MHLPVSIIYTWLSLPLAVLVKEQACEWYHYIRGGRSNCCFVESFINLIHFYQEERLLRMGDELSRLASYEAECHRKDGVIAALRDEVVDLKGALQSSGGFRYS